MIVAGLTGSIAMGKSTAAAMFAAEGAAVFAADAAVHAYYSSPESAASEAAFPGVRRDGVVNRDLLAARVLGYSDAIARLEAIVHPEVARRRRVFLDEARAQGLGVAILDIPLLFETGAQDQFDAIIVVTAPASVQAARALARAGMSPKRFAALLARQTPDEQKRRRAHFIIDSAASLDATRAQVGSLYKLLTIMAGGRGAHA